MLNAQVDWENLEISWGLFFSLQCPGNQLQVDGMNTQPGAASKEENQGNCVFWERVFSLFCFFPLLVLVWTIAPYRDLTYL